MFKTIFKWFLRAVSLCVVTVLVALLVLQFSPQTYLRLASQFSPYEVQADTAEVSIIPLVVELSGLTVEDKKTNTQQLNLNHVLAKVSLKKVLNKHNNVWYLEVRDGEITPPPPTEKKADKNKTAINTINIHNLLSKLNVKANNINLSLNKDTALSINEFSTHLDSDNHQSPDDVKQNIILQLLYKQSDKKVAINGTLDSKKIDGVNHLALSLDQLDLTPFLAKTNTPSETNETNESSELTDNKTDEPQTIDWSWLNAIEKTVVNIGLKQFILNENKIDNLNFEATLDNEIQIKTLASNVQWALGDSLSFNKQINLFGNLKGLQDGNIETLLTLNLAANSPEQKNNSNASDSDDVIKVDGVINPLSPLDSNASITAKLSTLPIDLGKELQANEVNDLNIDATILEGDINIKQLSSKVKWALNNSMSFNKTVELLGRLKLLQDNNIETQLTLNLAANALDQNNDSNVPDDVIKIDGVINSVSPLDSNASITAQLSTLPIDLGKELQANEINDLNIDATILEGDINIKQLSSKVKWELDNSMSFNKTVEVLGRLKILQDNNIETQLTLNLPIDSHEQKNDSDSSVAKTDFISIDGIVNSSSPLDSDVSIDAKMSAIPVNPGKEQQANFLLYEQFLPASINTKYQKNDDTYQISNLQLVAGKNDLSGSIQVANGDIIEIEADVQSKQIHYQSAKTEESEKSPPKKQKTDAVFSKEELDWSWLDKFKINASLEAKKVEFNELSFSNVNLPIALQAGNLNVDSFSTIFGKSNLTGAVSLKKSASQTVNLETNIKADDIDLSTLSILKDTKQLQGGLVSTDISLTSQGKSPHDIVSKLNGNALVSLHDAVIGNGAFELIGSDLILELLSKLNPFAKSDPTTQLKCAIVNLPIENGLITINNSIAVQTSKVAIIAKGNVNLSDETLKLDIKPISTGGLGIGAGNLVKLISIGGKLNAPKPIVGATGLLKTGAAVGAAISTGGATVIADSLLSKNVAKNACENALKSS